MAPAGSARSTSRTARRTCTSCCIGITALIERAGPCSVGDKLGRYFAGEFGALDDIAVSTNGSAFQQRVWATLRRIPAGRVATYGALAAELGGAAHARQVGGANAANPIALIVPCHRVVGKDGDLKGFAWGLARKAWLLAHEKANVDGGASRRLPGC
jgi:methylated-DNA-[protein]-cysteine S-methyltransferase